MNFYRIAGFTKKGDRLPAMFYKEELLPYHGAVSYVDEELDVTLEPFK